MRIKSLLLFVVIFLDMVAPFRCGPSSRHNYDDNYDAKPKLLVEYKIINDEAICIYNKEHVYILSEDPNEKISTIELGIEPKDLPEGYKIVGYKILQQDQTESETIINLPYTTKPEDYLGYYRGNRTVIVFRALFEKDGLE